MKMRDIFEKNPAREISRVVKIDQHEDNIVGTEVEEYVVTEQIHRLLQDFIDQFLESRRGRSSDVCVWLSGFFGSGKSHLAKMIGYILTNREVTLPNGSRVRVADYFHRKHGISGTGILARELKTRALFLNMLNFDRARDEDLSRYIYRALLRDLGLSEVLWVAEVERMLKEEGLYERFKQVVEEETGEPWEKVREIEIKIRPALVKALTKIKPEAYPNITIAQQAVEDQRREFLLGPERLARRLVEEAKMLDKEQGRIVLILDEIGLYLRTNGDRLTELNSLAEQIEKQGKGKVWLIATAQEALETVAPDAPSEHIGWLKDRFSLKYRLSPENIPQVTYQRLLKKNKTSQSFEELKQLYDRYEGQLAMGARIQNPARDQEIFSKFDFESFSESYPLMPYHIDLMIDIFSVLRAKGRKMGQESKLAGRERAVLSVVQSILIELLKRDAEVGTLATFDLIYDSIESVLKIVSSDYNSLITERIAELGSVDDLRVSSVAKALFLLQQVKDWIPTTVENVAAVLYPRLGEDPIEHKKRVEKCLELLVERNWVKEEEGKYRFLSEPERNFERDVCVQEDQIRLSEIEERMIEIAKGILKDMKKYNHKKVRVFDVHLFIDEEEITRRGHLKLKVYTPLWSSQHENPIEDLYFKSLGEEDAVYWIGKADESFRKKLRRIIAVEKILNDRMKMARSPQEVAELETYREEVETTIHDELPKLLESSLKSGTILFFGESEEIGPRTELSETFNKWMRRLVEKEFTRFDEAAVRVEKDEIIRSILTWDGGKLPGVYSELKLIDRQNTIVTSGPVAHAIFEHIKRLGEVTGAEIIQQFEKPPYGWDEKVIRLVMATLFKHLSIQVEHGGQTYTSPEDPLSHVPFVKLKEFQKAKFRAGPIITTEEKKKVRELISRIFGKDAGVTLEQISETIKSAAEENIKTIQDLKTKEGYRKLPYGKEIEKLEEAFRRLLDKAPHLHRVLLFLEPEVLDPIENHMPLLEKLNDFVEKGKLTIYLKMRDFARTPLSDLIRLDSSFKETGDSFRNMLSSKILLDEWKSIYDRFIALREKYRDNYIKEHRGCQIEVEDAIKELELWAKEKDVKPEDLEKAKGKLESLSCTGEEPAFDKATFLCGKCKRTLSTIMDHRKLVQTYLEEAKKELIKTIAKEERPKFKKEIFLTKEIVGEGDLRSIISEVTELVRYWIERGRRIRLKIEGEVEGDSGG